MEFKENAIKTFDFGVITYNQQDVIIETLESIKYLIENYGKGIEIGLIIGDDCSKDDTVSLCKSWINENKKLFSYSVILENTQNRGTVINFLKVFKKIKSSHFKIMDGDDVFSSRNLFELYRDIPKNEIFTCVPFGIDKRGEYRDITNDYWYFSKQNKDKLASIMSYQNIFLSGSTFMRKELICDSTIDLMKNFFLLEDYPMFYEVVKRTKAEIRFFDTPYIIYRVRDDSVSHSKVLNKSYLVDNVKMCALLKKNANNFFAYVYLSLATLSFNIRCVYFQPIKYLGKILLLMRKYGARRYGKQLLHENIERELEHFAFIKKRARLFLSSFKK